MKAFTGLLLFVFSLPNLLYAQADGIDNAPIEESYRAFLGFGVGPSFPFGSFAQKDLNSLEGGYAKTGFTINADFTYRIYKGFILTALYSSTRNSYDDRSLIGNGTSIWPTLSQAGTLISASASDYQLNTFMIGYGFIKELPNYSFQFQMMVGSATMYTPDLKVERQSQNEISTLNVKAQTERDVSYSVGAALRVHLNDELDFYTQGNFIVFQSDFDREYTIEGPPLFTEESTLRYQVFNLSLGLAYRFIKKEDEPKDQLRY